MGRGNQCEGKPGGNSAELCTGLGKAKVRHLGCILKDQKNRVATFQVLSYCLEEEDGANRQTLATAESPSGTFGGVGQGAVLEHRGGTI